MFFTGTSTGNLYETGQRYRGGNGDTYVANPDGSFTNERSQVTLTGSSRSSNVEWYDDGRRTRAPSALSGGGSGPGSESVVTGVSYRVVAGGAGPGSSVVVAKRGGGSLTFGVPWQSQETPPADYELGPYGWVKTKSPKEVKGRPLPMGPFNFEMSPYMPSAQVIEDEVGEGDFLSPGWFANWGAAIGHIGWNVERWYNQTNENFEKNSRAGIKARDKVWAGRAAENPDRNPLGPILNRLAQ